MVDYVKENGWLHYFYVDILGWKEEHRVWAHGVCYVKVRAS